MGRWNLKVKNATTPRFCHYTPFARLAMRSLLLAIIGVGLWSSVCLAEDIFVAQSTAGAGNGTDCANARSASWFNTAANWGAGANLISAGDTVRLCGTFTSALIVQGSGSFGNPITIRYESGAKHSNGPGWGTGGAISATSKNFITIDGGTDGRIEATANGTGLANQLQSYGLYLSLCHDCTVRSLTISNMYVRTPNSSDSNSLGRGMYIINCDRIEIHNNAIDDAFYGINYNYDGGRTTPGGKIHHNTTTNVSTGITYSSGNTNAISNNGEIYNNDIEMTTAWLGTWTPPPGDGHHHNDGIHAWAVHAGSQMNNLTIYNNYIHGAFGTGNMTGAIFPENTGGGTADNGQAYNNVLVATSGQPTNGFIVIKGGDNWKIYNNTIVGANVSGGNDGIRLQNTSTGADIKNNIITNIRTGIVMATASDTISASNYNIFQFLGSTNQMGCHGSLITFASWLANLCSGITLQDLNSLNINPQLDANYRPQTGSPAVDGGVDLSGFFTSDRDGTSRPQGPAWDIGAFEVGDGAIPNPPTNLRVTMRD